LVGKEEENDKLTHEIKDITKQGLGKRNEMQDEMYKTNLVQFSMK
jgi:hypothetical protein